MKNSMRNVCTLLMLLAITSSLQASASKSSSSSSAGEIIREKADSTHFSASNHLDPIDISDSSSSTLECNAVYDHFLHAQNSCNSLEGSPHEILPFETLPLTYSTIRQPLKSIPAWLHSPTRSDSNLSVLNNPIYLHKEKSNLMLHTTQLQNNAHAQALEITHLAHDSTWTSRFFDACERCYFLDACIRLYFRYKNRNKVAIISKITNSSDPSSERISSRISKKPDSDRISTRLLNKPAPASTSFTSPI